LDFQRFLSLFSLDFPIRQISAFKFRILLLVIAHQFINKFAREITCDCFVLFLRRKFDKVDRCAVVELESTIVFCITVYVVIFRSFSTGYYFVFGFISLLFVVSEVIEIDSVFLVVFSVRVLLNKILPLVDFVIDFFIVGQNISDVFFETKNYAKKSNFDNKSQISGKLTNH
jgi:hypothetical protein